MLKIGLTGGIGSGKTTVASLFEILGIPVFYSDIEAKQLMNRDEFIINAIKIQFGEKSYVDNKLNSTYLSEIVFNNPSQLNWLNQLIHPATINASKKWMESQFAAYVIKESALLFESGAEKGLDFTIGVHTIDEIRIQRIIKRSGISREDVAKRIAKQMDESEKMSKCDFIIDNNEKELLMPQVLKLHEHFLQLSKSH
jgi:dephospho-CoA kinase